MNDTVSPVPRGICGFINVETGERCCRAQLSRGYCGSHYQQARRWDWPLPCPPEGHRAIQLRRGRPRKAS